MEAKFVRDYLDKHTPLCDVFIDQLIPKGKKWQEKIYDSLEDIASYILGEMKIQVGKLDFDEFERRITKWNKENNLEFAKFEETDSVTYLSKHDLGKNWSEMQCKIYSKMFEKVGKTVIEKEFDNVTFSVTIARPPT